jgi:dephospho-CoA kinase
MQGSLVVLTGASGAGKTTLARAIHETCSTNCDVLFFDSIGVPPADQMKAYGEGYQPGGAWQRAMTIQWIERITKILLTGRSVLLEGQMRIAFIHDALQKSGISGAHVVLVDCDEATRTTRLNTARSQPNLANPDMMNWARFLREEARLYGCEILDSSRLSIAECVSRLRLYLEHRVQ